MTRLNLTRVSKVAVVFALVLAACGLPTRLAPADNPHGPSISAVNGEWSGKFWQWLLSVPADGSPALDATGANAFNGQPAGNVFFLCGTFITDEPFPGVILGQADRTITVP